MLHLALDPEDPDLLYAVTPTGVFRSADAAATWETTAPGLEEVEVTDLEIDPIDRSILYASTRGGGVLLLEQE